MSNNSKNEGTSSGTMLLRLESSLWGLAVCGLSSLALLSLLSFSVGEDGKPGPDNLIGPLGGWVAYLLLSALGIGAYLLLAAFLLMGVSITRKSHWRLKGRQVAGGLLALLAILYLAHMIGDYPEAWPASAGGEIGAWLCEMTRAIFGAAGTAIIAVLLLIAGISLLTALTPYSLLLRLLAGSSAVSSRGWSGLLWIWRKQFSGAAQSSPDKAAPPLQTESHPVFEDSAEQSEVLQTLRSDAGAAPVLELKASTRNDKKAAPPVAEEGDAGQAEDQEAPSAEEEPDATVPEHSVSRGLSQEAEVPIIDAPPDYICDDNEDDQPPIFLPRSEPAFTRRPFQLPSIELLDYHAPSQGSVDKDALQEAAQVLTHKLLDFKVSGEVVGIHPGPVVSLFEFRPGRAVKVAQIANLSKDLAMALAAEQVRVIAPIPGKDVVGIEVPNKVRENVFLRELLSQKTYSEGRNALPIVLGKDISGKHRVADLTKMPHLLIAGTTGSGKSVAMHSYILSILYKLNPEQVRFLLVDPKMLELTLYNDIPHLLHPVVTSAKEATVALRWLVGEMERRNRLMSEVGVPNIAEYNELLTSSNESRMRAKVSRTHTRPDGSQYSVEVDMDDHKPLPYIVVVIDELADLMFVAGKQVETSVARLAQMARAGGIHMMIATQNPTIKVMTGIIKANMPARLSFKVRTMQDSRVILDQNGADDLLGFGDMLFLAPGSSKLQRIHGAFVSTEERTKVIEFLRGQGTPDYNHEIMAAVDPDDPGEDGDPDSEGSRLKEDELYEDAVAMAIQWGRVSTSKIQQEFGIGYNRAARIMAQMEKEGLVGPPEGAGKARVVLK